MMITRYHSKYYAHELTLRRLSDSVEKFSSTLANAQVDINPHQIEAALFAFRSPLSKGAILADEVWLGKTIEAWIVIAQKWAEKKRKILLIVPANLRKQWMSELSEKFFLPTKILEQKSFNAIIKSWNLNPFVQDEDIVITSYQFARSKSPYVKKIEWDLVVIDEAHRLRNVYKTGNKIAKEIKEAVGKAPKILLTATPLQNSLLELYGLVSIIDEHHFGDLKSFKAKYSKIPKEQTVPGNADAEISTERPSNEMFSELKERLQPICHRTLRRQVLEYIKYTKRIPLTQDYYPGEDESELYQKMSAYLQTDRLYALPNSQRQLVTLVLRKLLASSSFAISQTLERLIYRLESLIEEAEKQVSANQNEVDIGESVFDSFETYSEMTDEWVDDEEWDSDDEETNAVKTWTAADIVAMKNEKEVLSDCHRLAKAIFKNSKGDSLLIALEKGFEMTEELGAKKKALIFTESTVTQGYIKRLLESNGYTGKVIVFNGSNNDPDSQAIYQKWVEKYRDTDKISGSKTADTRAAIVDAFKDEAEIMIATEAGAEGVNLQFCSLLINYDLPWNPQRIEQRIWRCHRYGQKHDVVVINFINRRNAADARIYQLLDEKFNLFKWVFGASDEVLWAIESGVDFEKRISDILRRCRSEEEISASFDELQKEMDESIRQSLGETRQKLLENFDEDVRARLKANKDRSQEFLDTFDSYLWNLTKHYLWDAAEFVEDGYFFTLRRNPFPGENIAPGPYRIGKDVEDAHIYRPNHPLANNIISAMKSSGTPDAEIHFDYSSYGGRISILEWLCGRSGFAQFSKLSLSSFEPVDEILATGFWDDGTPVEHDVLKKLWKLPWSVVSNHALDASIVQKLMESEGHMETAFISSVDTKNSEFFDEEITKLEKWADDMRTSIEVELKYLDVEIATLKTQSRKLIDLLQKFEAQKKIKDLESKRSEMRKNLFNLQDEIDRKKEALLSNVEARMKQNIHKEELFRIRFKIV